MLSTQWMRSELASAQEMVDDLYEDFVFAANDELDWISDRMDGILHDSNFVSQSIDDSRLKSSGKPLPSPAAHDKENVEQHSSPRRQYNSSISSLTTSPILVRQSILSAVAEFAPEPADPVSSSSPIPGHDHYIEGDFFGTREREILALDPGNGSILDHHSGSSITHSPHHSDPAEAMDVDSGLLDELETSVHYDDNKSVNFPADRRSNNNSSPFRSEHLPSSPAQPPSHHSSFLDSNMQPPVKTNRSLQSLFSESSLSSSQHDASFYSANDKQSPADPRTTPNTRSSAVATSSAHRSGLHPQSSPNTFTPMHINPLAQSTPFNHPAPRSTPISASSARREPYSPAVASSPRGILRSPATHNLSQTPTTPNPSTTASSATVPATTTAVHQSTTVTTVPLKNSPASPQVTFASLPAKAPLTTKKSFGKRVSDLSSAKSSMTHKSSDFSDEQQISSNHRSESSRSSPQSAPNQSTPVAASSSAAADETQKTVVKPGATSQQSGMTPAHMLYNNLQSHSDDTRDDEEEDWIPLSKTTPAPRSRFLNTALYKDASEKVAGRDTQRAVVEEENEEEPQVLEKAVEIKQTAATSTSDARSAVPTTETKNGTDESERNPSANTTTTTKEVPSYLSSTTSSRLKSSPTKSVVTGLPPASPLRPQNGATLTGRGSPLRPPMSFSTRTQGSPVRNRSPLRNTVSRPASPQRKASDEDKQSKKPETVSKLPTSTAVSPLRQQPSIRLQMSPARSNLSRSASQLTINQASSIAVAAAASAQVNGHSPMTSALRNMKSSTADVFRRARMLLFDNEANNKSGGKQQQQSSSGKELVHVSGAGSLSPVKKVQNATKESSEQSSGKASKNMYPDISALLVDNAGSPGRLANNHGYAEGASSSNQGYMSASNPAKALFQAPNAFRSTAAASLITSASQASTTSDGTVSTQRTSFDSGPESGDLKLSPAHSKPTGAAAGTVAAAAAAINSATAGSANNNSSLGLRDNKQQPTTKRVKSVVRKPATRAKQAPVVVRVPMGAQRELEQQRKFAHTVTATVPASTSQEATSAEVAHQQPSASNEDESQPAKKTEQKREIDRRRQENARRAAMQQQQQQQQAEEKKRADEEEQARRKFALANRNSRVPQTRAVANLVRTEIEEATKPMKRNFQIDGEPGRLKNSLVPTAASMQDQSKRRRTDEMSGSPIEAKVRHSVVRKDHLQGSGASAAGSKAIGGRQVPIVEGVKFSNEKIRFAGSANAASTASSQESNVQSASSSTSTGMVGGPARRTTNSGENGALPSTTPGRPNLKNASQHGSQVRLSQLAAMPVNSGDHIVLPEIYSESEDDEEDSVILDWAHSPYLREALRQQQQIDPDTVFGPVPPLSMEEVFRNRAGVSAARFRPRSSSANWSNNDRLTPQEIEAYAQEMGYNRPQPQQQDAE